MWALEDLKSINGTLANGASFTRHNLSPRDFIQLEDTVFSFLASPEMECQWQGLGPAAIFGDFAQLLG